MSALESLAPGWAKEASVRGVQAAEESLAEQKRHNAEVERLLTEIRDRLPSPIAVVQTRT